MQNVRKEYGLVCVDDSGIVKGYAWEKKDYPPDHRLLLELAEDHRVVRAPGLAVGERAYRPGMTRFRVARIPISASSGSTTRAVVFNPFLWHTHLLNASAAR